MDQGKVLEVTISFTGGEFAGDHAAGLTVLALDDVHEFDEAGGQVIIGDDVYTYLSINDDTSAMTLASALLEPFEDGDPVLMYPLSEEKWANVDVPNLDDSIRARVPHTLAPQFDDGIREEYDQESVLIDLDDDLGDWVVLDVIAKIPTIDGVYINPTTLPVAGTDGLPPAAAPTPTAVGGIGLIHVRWEPIVNHDLVTYQLHMSTDPDFVPAWNDPTLVTETVASSHSVRTLPDGTPLAYGVTYHFALITSDVDGIGPTGTPGPGASMMQITSPDIAVDALWAGFMSVGRLLGGTMDADVILAGLIRTAASGSRVEIGPEGITIYDAAGIPAIILPSNLSDLNPAEFRGKGEFEGLIVKGNAEYRGMNNFQPQSTLKLASSLKPPAAAPTMESYWPTVEFTGMPAGSNASQIRTINWDSIGSLWWATSFNDDYELVIDKFTANGVWFDRVPQIIGGSANSIIYGAFMVGGVMYHMLDLYNTIVPQITIYKQDGSIVGKLPDGVGYGGGSDGTNMILAEFYDDTDKFGLYTYGMSQAEGANLIPNPGAEVNTTGWVANNANSTLSRAVSPEITGQTGTGAFKIRSGTGSTGSTAGMKVDAGASMSGLTRLTLRLRRYAPVVDRVLYAKLNFYNSSGVLFDSWTYTLGTAGALNTWVDQEENFSVFSPSGTSTVRLELEYQNVGFMQDTGYLDDITLVKSSGINLSSFAVTSVNSGFGIPFTNILRGSFDLGSTHTIMARRDTGVHHWVFNSSLTYQPIEAFSIPTGGALFLGWDGTRFWTLGTDHKLHKHSLVPRSGTSSVKTYYGKYTWRDINATGGTHESPPSPQAQISLPRRASIRMTGAAIPYNGGTDDPNAVGIYVGDVSGTVWKQADSLTLENSVILDTVTLSGTNPPMLSDFPTSTPAKIESDDGTLIISGDGSVTTKQLDITDTWKTYTPAWTSTGTQPTIGNGVRQGRYVKLGKLVHFVWEMTFGSTTTFGSGVYSIGLPFPIASGTGINGVFGGEMVNSGLTPNFLWVYQTVSSGASSGGLRIPSFTTHGDFDQFTATNNNYTVSGTTITVNGTYETSS